MKLLTLAFLNVLLLNSATALDCIGFDFPGQKLSMDKEKVQLEDSENLLSFEVESSEVKPTIFQKTTVYTLSNTYLEEGSLSVYKSIHIGRGGCGRGGCLNSKLVSAKLSIAGKSYDFSCN